MIKEYHNGFTRDEIAAMFGISTGTVSNIIKEYEDALAIVDLEPIRKDLKTIRKHSFTVKEYD